MAQRRSFITKLLLGGSMASLLFMNKLAVASPKGIKNSLVHHVFFWLKEPQNQADREQLQLAFQELVKIKTIKQYHLGLPAGTEQRDVVDHSYTFSLLLFFDSQADQDAYQVDPLHLKFVDENKQLWTKVVVYDSVNF